MNINNNSPKFPVPPNNSLASVISLASPINLNRGLIIKRFHLLSRLMILPILLSFISLKTQAIQGFVLKSASEPVQFLELYTSQGCSSCPPAEKWINGFTDDQRLWKTLFPLNFHVDYWDYLGWEDPYARQQFSQRQRRYHTLGRTQNVATPGFVINGHGWNGWFRRQTMRRPGHLTNIQLEVSVGQSQVHVKATNSPHENLIAHVAILGFGIETLVQRGENKGKSLSHDFVVIGYEQSQLQASTTRKSTPQSISKFETALPLPPTVANSRHRQAIVVWVADKRQPAPLQVVGGWFNPSQQTK